MVSLAIGITLCTTTVAQEPSKEDAAFVREENAVRHEFMLAHPYVLPGNLAKYQSKMSEDELFPLSFATTMANQSMVFPKERRIPTWWENRVELWLTHLPHGEALGDAYYNRGEAKRIVGNNAAIDKRALENIENLKKLTVIYKTATSEQFDEASPLLQVRYIFNALLMFEDDIHSPCPFTIYMVDEADKDDEIATSITSTLGVMLGKDSPEYQGYRTFSRRQKTAALRKLYRAFLESAIKALEKPDAESLKAYFGRVNYQIAINGDRWTLIQENEEKHSDRDIIFEMFGQKELDEFNKRPSGAERDVVRVSAFLLWTQFRSAVAGMMVS